MSQTQAQYKVLRKITVKSVYGGVDVEKVLAAPNKLLPVMQVYGIVTDSKEGASDYGDYIKFLGQFRAINMETGEMFRAATMLLPKFLEDELRGIMSSGAVNAEFAVQINATYDKSAATKYVYVADSLVEPQESSALSALEQRIASAKALPNPDKKATGKK